MNAFLEKAEAMKPQLIETWVKPDITTCILRQGDRVLFDFGNHYVGYLFLSLAAKGRHQDAPVQMKFRFYEIASEIGEDVSDYRGRLSKSWIQEETVYIDVLPMALALPRRYAFRYVELTVEAMSSKHTLALEDISAKTVSSASRELTPIGRSDAERLIDRVALRTLSECMQYEFEDGPKRDRRLWLGDLRLQALVNYKTFGENDLVKRCLYLFAGIADDDGNISACLFTTPQVEADQKFMLDYSLLFSVCVADYFEHTGDRETTETLFPLALRQLTLASTLFVSDVIPNFERSDWCFLDWSPSLHKQAGAQAVYIYTLKAMRRLAEALGKELSWLDEEIKAKSAAMIDAFYDRERGLFVSGEEKQISYASNAWACLAEVFDADTNAALLQRLEKSDAVKPVTPYMYHYYVTALLEVGLTERGYEVMMRYWGAMAKSGADTFFEIYNPDDPEESPYGARSIHSYCHAWSCTPSYLLRKYFLDK